MKIDLSAKLKGHGAFKQVDLPVRLLEEKIARELNISLEELKELVIKVKNGEVSIEQVIKEKK